MFIFFYILSVKKWKKKRNHEYRFLTSAQHMHLSNNAVEFRIHSIYSTSNKLYSERSFEKQQNVSFE